MHLSPRGKWAWHCAAAVGMVLAAAGMVRAQHDDCLCLEQLRRMSPCQLADLFARSEVGTPLAGCGRGEVLYLADRRFSRVQVRLVNMLWRGKAATDDGHFVNRWAGGIEAIGSKYVIGPSWVDGRPAMLMEYPPGTPILGNVHDELREVAPGLYLGPIYDRCPCPKFRGYLAVQVER